MLVLEKVIQSDHKDRGENDPSQPELRYTVERHFSEPDPDEGGRDREKNEPEEILRVFAGLPHERVPRNAAGEKHGLEDRDGFRFRPGPGVGVDDDGRTADVEGSGDDPSD